MRIEPIPSWGFHATGDDWEELNQRTSALSQPRVVWYIRYRTTWWRVSTDDASYISFDDARKFILLAS